jgi:hypothetical protein
MVPLRFDDCPRLAPKRVGTTRSTLPLSMPQVPGSAPPATAAAQLTLESVPGLEHSDLVSLQRHRI